MPKEAVPLYNRNRREKQIRHQTSDEEAAGEPGWGKPVVKADRAWQDAVMVMEAVPQVRSSLPSTKITMVISHWPNFKRPPL
jgi:hypothetical protein